MKKSILVSYIVSFKELMILLDNEDWEGAIPEHLINKLRKKLKIPKPYKFDHIESESLGYVDCMSEVEEIERYSDTIYIGFEYECGVKLPLKNKTKR